MQTLVRPFLSVLQSTRHPNRRRVYHTNATHRGAGKAAVRSPAGRLKPRSRSVDGEGAGVFRFSSPLATQHNLPAATSFCVLQSVQGSWISEGHGRDGRWDRPITSEIGTN